jgi:hypothetical protein
MKKLPSSFPIVSPTPQNLRDLVISIAVEDPITELSGGGSCSYRTQLDFPMLVKFFLF